MTSRDPNGAQVVDACRKGNRARFINHSDSANAGPRIMSTRGEHHIGIFAKRPIEKDHEIFFDYRYDVEEREHFGFKRARRRGRPPGAPTPGGKGKRPCKRPACSTADEEGNDEACKRLKATAAPEGE